MDISQDWCFFDKVWEKPLPTSTQSNYSVNLISISEPSGWIFVADGKNLLMINSNSILDYPNSGPTRSIAFDLPITYLSCSQSGTFLGLAQTSDLFILKIQDLIQGNKSPEIYKFNSQIRVLEWHQDHLGVITLEKHFEIWTVDSKIFEKDSVSYFTFINQDTLVLADDKNLGVYCVRNSEYKNSIETDAKTIGLKFLKGIIFQFTMNDESEPCLNLFDGDLKLISKIDFIDCFPFAPQDSLANGGSDLEFVSFFYYIEQRDTILLSSTCSIYVDVLIKNSEYEKVNFEENLQGQCRSGWFDRKENTQRGFCMIKKYGNPTETFDFQLKDTLYTISKPPLILFVDSGGILQLRRFVDLRSQYLNNNLCESSQTEEVKTSHIIQPTVKITDANLQTPKKEEKKTQNVEKNEETKEKSSIFGNPFNQLKLSENTQPAPLKEPEKNPFSLNVPKPQENIPGLSLAPQSNPLGSLQQPSNITAAIPTNIKSNAAVNPFKNTTGNEPQKSNPFAMISNQPDPIISNPIVAQPSPISTKPSSNLIKKIDNLMQSLITSLKKSAKEVQDMQINQLTSINLYENLEKTCTRIAEFYVKTTEKVKNLQEKTDDLEAWKEIIERNLFLLDSDEQQDDNVIDFYDDITDWEKSLNVSALYYRSALQPITKLYLDTYKQLNSSNRVEDLSHVKKTRSYLDMKKFNKIDIPEETIRQATQQSINNLKKSLRNLKTNMNSARNIKKTSKTVYKFEIENSDEESEVELKFQYIDPREYKKLRFNKIT